MPPKPILHPGIDKIRFRLLPIEKKRDVFYGDRSRLGCKFIADAQGDLRCQNSIGKGILQPLQGDAVGIAACGKDGTDTLHGVGKGERRIGDRGQNRTVAQKKALTAAVCNALQQGERDSQLILKCSKEK